MAATVAEPYEDPVRLLTRACLSLSYLSSGSDLIIFGPESLTKWSAPEILRGLTLEPIVGMSAVRC